MRNAHSVDTVYSQDLIDTDVTLYVYSALKTQQPGEEILRWLQVNLCSWCGSEEKGCDGGMRCGGQWLC